MNKVLFIALFAMSGCATVEEYSFMGNDEFSEITLESSMPNWNVDTYISTSAEDCKEFKSAGKLFYDAQLRSDGVLGSLQKINPLRQTENISVTQRIPNNSVIQIKAFANFYSGNLQGSCGPLVVKMLTGEGEKYKIHVHESGKKCHLKAINLSTGKSVGNLISCGNSVKSPMSFLFN